ncbi:MAG TPA: hypothetical protein VEL07_07595 [Planctomycetota bacterium]|nr:hypothetical protein [Planctomycetota bacterium]
MSNALRDITTAVFRRSTRAAMAASVIAAAGGAELVIADVRVGLHALPTDFDYTVTDSEFDGHESADSTSFDYGFGLGVRGIYSFSSPGAAGGFFAGAEAFVGVYEYSHGPYRSLTGRVLGGYAYAFTEKLSMEITPFIGYGLSTFALSGEIEGQQVIDDIEFDGTVIEYGAMLGASYALTRSILIVAEAGWMQTTGDLSGDGIDIEMEQAGPAFFLGAVWRINGAPPRIE